MTACSFQCNFGFQEKLAILEQKLLKEEHERLLVQEKADQVSLHSLRVAEECTFSPYDLIFHNLTYIVSAEK